ncbi:MAG: hypothetical protein JSU63_19065 [Phycisphaerales bacterium]|nr:MAG: hypothetical protein JSU63_19065 [Phycisphaerales bacterium]
MSNTSLARRMKAAMLTAVVAVGGTVFASCGWTDLRYNFVAGTQAFVKGYTTDMWEAIVPAPGDLINFAAAEE